MKRVELKGGDYLGEISALCFLHVPSSISPLPFLLAGTGSQILLFDVNLGRLINSFYVFDGVRVHGIASKGDSCSSSLTFDILVSGERRLKLFSLHLQLDLNSLNVSANLIFLHLLPTFTHWVLDFCFLKDAVSSAEGSCRYLAVGCSDNSIHVWDIIKSSFVLQEAKCPERCLLYSMKIWGHERKALVIASGTIFNEIVVWKLALTNDKNDTNVKECFDDVHEVDGQFYEAKIVSRLSGHQGSIFCLSWSSDGSTLVSVSDDRSARMWIIDTETNLTDDLGKLHGPYSTGPMLFGHSARVWDCCISDSIIVTAGEDCSCRVWGLDGKELRIIKEHIGRGIWRCLYDLNSSLLVTAGFDSAIKVHCLPTSSSFLGKSINEVNERKAVVMQVCIPNPRGHTGLMDSKSEYVRCLKFAREDTIYVATNHGYVYHAKLYENGSIEWTELVIVTEEVPVICLDLLSKDLSEPSLGVEDWVAVGDGKGAMKVLEVRFRDGTPKVDSIISWLAETERQLLGVYWCKSLGHRFIFTSNPKGLLKLWRLSVLLSNDGVRNWDAHLVAYFMSPFGARIMSLDASFEEEVLICGDLRGNLVLFPLSKNILLEASPLAIENTSWISYFKGAHGISSVSSISIARFSSTLTEICSTGGDGCICYLEYFKERQTLEFVGMKQTKELSLVQSVSAGHYSLDDSADISYAIGFSSTDFLIWNLISETKVLQIKCGGWRRPHSFHLGKRPEISSSFAYVKDEIIYIHRNRVIDIGEKIFPRNLHLQFHGREIHSLCIIPEVLESTSTRLHFSRPISSWIATGCEDGTVRLTRYDHDTKNWAMSNLLGEHVGGSAVRSLCFVSKVHSAEAKVVEGVNGTFDTENNERPSLLISVGAKRVLTSWLLRSRQISESDASSHGVENNNGGCKSSLRGLSTMSFKWLSTDMPVKSSCVRKKAQYLDIPFDAVQDDKYVSTPEEMELKKHEDAHDNDWRYLAVTAFLVNVAQSRLTVCFVLIACSDATLMLRALVLPYRYWFDVASLAHLSSPVLALQHAVTPIYLSTQGTMMTKNMYMAVSGSTDGSIAFWDLTASVEAFLQHCSFIHEDKSIDIQKRPRTGRGSQGGRWWKSVIGSTADKKPTGSSTALKKVCVSKDSGVSEHQMYSNNIGTVSCGPGGSAGDSCSELSVIKPLHVLYNVHQSGVNCLHLCCHILGDTSQYSIISGGDDQALNFLQVAVTSSQTSLKMDEIGNIDTISEAANTENAINNSNESCRINFLLQKKVFSAHSSAVKGVWTDGIWCFSVGLDQRTRCWNLQADGNLAEYAHFVTSVPEPETLDVKACESNCFQVIVAGRGMQIIEVLVSHEKEGE